jgi:hypothetical protein
MYLSCITGYFEVYVHHGMVAPREAANALPRSVTDFVLNLISHIYGIYNGEGSAGSHWLWGALG